VSPRTEIRAGTASAPHVIVPSPLWQSVALPHISPGGQRCLDCLSVLSLSEAILPLPDWRQGQAPSMPLINSFERFPRQAVGSR